MLADIGTHAFNLMRYTTGLFPESVSSQLKSFEAGRVLDDYGTAQIRFENGALGNIVFSQITHGRENGLWIEIDGTKAALEWHQEEPNQLWVRRNGQPHALYSRDRNSPYLTSIAKAASRLPPGHPEGFFEAFANVYRSAYDAMILRKRERLRHEEYDLSQRQRRSRRNVLYPAVRSLAQRRRCLETAAAQTREKMSNYALWLEIGKVVEAAPWHAGCMADGM